MAKIEEFYEDDYGNEKPVDAEMQAAVDQLHLNDTRKVSYQDAPGGAAAFEDFAAKHRIPGSSITQVVAKQWLDLYTLMYQQMHQPDHSLMSSPASASVRGPEEPSQHSSAGVSDDLPDDPMDLPMDAEGALDDVPDLNENDDYEDGYKAGNESEPAPQESNSEPTAEDNDNSEAPDENDDQESDQLGAMRISPHLPGTGPTMFSAPRPTPIKQRPQNDINTVSDDNLSATSESDRLSMVKSRELVNDSARKVKVDVDGIMHDIDSQRLVSGQVEITARLNGMRSNRPEVGTAYVDFVRAYFESILGHPQARSIIEKASAGDLLTGFIMFQLAVMTSISKRDYQKWCTAALTERVTNSNYNKLRDAKSLANVALDTSLSWSARFYALLLIQEPWKMNGSTNDSYALEEIRQNTLTNEALIVSMLNLQSPDNGHWNEDLIGDNVKALRNRVNNLQHDLTAPYKTFNRTKNIHRKLRQS